MKAATAKEAEKLLDIPNIGPAMARDFLVLGINKPADLKGKDPLMLYKNLCKQTGVRQDLSVLGTYMAAVDFINGAPARPWYYYTPSRKRKYPQI